MKDDEIVKSVIKDMNKKAFLKMPKVELTAMITEAIILARHSEKKELQQKLAVKEYDLRCHKDAIKTLRSKIEEAIDKELKEVNKELEEIIDYKQSNPIYRKIKKIIGNKDWIEQSECFYWARKSFLEELKKSLLGSGSSNKVVEGGEVSGHLPNIPPDAKPKSEENEKVEK